MDKYENRGNAAEHFLFDVVLSNLEGWKKGEWTGAVRSKRDEMVAKNAPDVRMGS